MLGQESEFLAADEGVLIAVVFPVVVSGVEGAKQQLLADQPNLLHGALAK